MNRDWHRAAIWLVWLALPTTARNHWRAWDRLPARTAVHFNANWQPNRRTTKVRLAAFCSLLFALCFLLFALGLITFMLALCTVAAYVVQALNPRASWPVLIAFYGALGFCGYGSTSIADYNLHRDRQARHTECAPATSARIRRREGFFNCICNGRRYVRDVTHG
jgi:hypothetical protein